MKSTNKQDQAEKTIHAFHELSLAVLNVYRMIQPLINPVRKKRMSVSVNQKPNAPRKPRNKKGKVNEKALSTGQSGQVHP
jgi:hypothetical protein